jgi:hypothetical protein
MRQRGSLTMWATRFPDQSSSPSLHALRTRTAENWTRQGGKADASISGPDGLFKPTIPVSGERPWV